jgi:hypothetical protein
MIDPLSGASREEQIAHVIAQLRHAYANLLNRDDKPWTEDRRESFAVGLIAPQIVALELLTAAFPDGWKTLSDQLQQLHAEMDRSLYDWIDGTKVLESDDVRRWMDRLRAISSHPRVTPEQP